MVRKIEKNFDGRAGKDIGCKIKVEGSKTSDHCIRQQQPVISFTDLFTTLVTTVEITRGGRVSGTNLIVEYRTNTSLEIKLSEHETAITWYQRVQVTGLICFLQLHLGLVPRGGSPRAGVLNRNFEKIPKRKQGLVIWAWLQIFFTPNLYQF